jgi:hypothetical protein
MSDAGSTLVPRHKTDLTTARRAVEAGWPAVRPVLRELVGWCLDGNWPVAKVLGPFIGSLGSAVADPVREVLQAEDAPAAYFVITGVVAEMPPSGVASVESDLRRLAQAPTPEQEIEELPRLAIEQLGRLDASA